MVGTLVKQLKLRPSVIKEVSDEVTYSIQKNPIYSTGCTHDISLICYLHVIILICMCSARHLRCATRSPDRRNERLSVARRRGAASAARCRRSDADADADAGTRVRCAATRQRTCGCPSRTRADRPALCVPRPPLPLSSTSASSIPF